MKRCPRCFRILPLGVFPIEGNSIRADGRRPYCQWCRVPTPEQRRAVKANAKPAAKAADTPAPLDGHAARLDRVIDKALAHMDEVLALRVPKSSKQYLSVMKLKTEVARAAIATQVRVDENRLRAMKGDKMDDLLEQIRKMELSLPSPLQAAQTEARLLEVEDDADEEG